MMAQQIRGYIDKNLDQTVTLEKISAARGFQSVPSSTRV